MYYEIKWHKSKWCDKKMIKTGIKIKGNIFII